MVSKIVLGTIVGAIGPFVIADTAVDNERKQHRLAGVGALMGYGTGVMMGIAHGLVRPYIADMPWSVAGALLGLATMATTDMPLAASGASHSREWSGADWLADLVPHLGYGLVAAAVYELLSGGSAGDTA